MNRVAFLSVLLISITLTFSSCESANKAEQHANRFFKHMIDHKFDAAIHLLDTASLVGVDYRSQIEYLADNPKNGKLIKAMKGTGFNTNIKNGVTTVKLPYNLTYEQGTIPFEVTIADQGEGLKIQSIQ